MTITVEPGSYKDPSGGVFYYQGKVCRWIADDADRFYQGFVGSDLFKSLVESKQFVPTAPLPLGDDRSLVEKFGSQSVFFEHERIPFISYPYEWPFSMLKDAAAHTLDLQITLLEKNLSLKDATPYNIQYRTHQPLFIDLSSVEKASANGVWIAYNQFCQMFLYPLFVHKFNQTDFRSIFLPNMEGLTLDKTVHTIGFHPFWKYGLLLDYLIPALITKTKRLKSAVTKSTISTSRRFPNSAEIQLRTARRLRKIIDKIRLDSNDSLWFKYTTTCLYSDKDYVRKMDFVKSCFANRSLKTALDLGCNTGDFSNIAADNGCNVVALDLDTRCVDHLYCRAKSDDRPILPLCLHIENPSPAIGWLNTERTSFLNRAEGRFDIVFALALVHHLLVTNRIPLPEIARLFRRLSTRYLIVEYVGPSDKMFRELTKYRTESYSHINQDFFEKNFSAHFKTIKKEDMIDPQRHMDRCLYLLDVLP